MRRRQISEPDGEKGLAKLLRKCYNTIYSGLFGFTYWVMKRNDGKVW